MSWPEPLEKPTELDSVEFPVNESSTGKAKNGETIWMMKMAEITSGRPLLRHDISPITPPTLHYYSQQMITAPLRGPVKSNLIEPLETVKLMPPIWRTWCW